MFNKQHQPAPSHSVPEGSSTDRSWGSQGQQEMGLLGETWGSGLVRVLLASRMSREELAVCGWSREHCVSVLHWLAKLGPSSGSGGPTAAPEPALLQEGSRLAGKPMCQQPQALAGFVLQPQPWLLSGLLLSWHCSELSLEPKSLG